MHLEDTGSGAVHERLDSDCNVNESAAKTPQLDAALEYARHGWPIFPVRPNKHPYTAHGFLDASADEQKVRSWWKKWPKAGIGLACGAAGVFVVDLDVDKEKGLDAVSLFEQLRDSRRHGSGLVVRTPRGGLHLYYKMPTPAVTSTARGEKHATLPGVDLRGEGGYAILPSPADSKRILEEGDIEDIGEAPAWILEELVGNRRVGPRAEKKEKTASKGPTVDEGRGRLSMRELVDIAGALERVDGAERDNWLRVGMALRSTGDPGVRFLWDRWSQQWPEKFNGANQDETWSSLKETRPDGREVTIATLFHMAKEPTPAAPPTILGRALSEIVESWRGRESLFKLSTGIPALDELTRGGITAGAQRVLLNGAPDAGKTMLLAQWADDWSRAGHAVAFLAIDEEADDLATRFLQRRGVARREIEKRQGLEGLAQKVADVPFLRVVESDELEEARDAYKARRRRGEDAEDPLVTLCQALRQHADKKEGRAALLMVDSLHALAPDDMEPRLAISHTCKQLKKLAKRFGVVVVATGEMNRAAYKTEASRKEQHVLAAGAESRSLEYFGRLILNCHSRREEGGRIELTIGKNKLGEKPLEPVVLEMNKERQELVQAEGQTASTAEEGKEAAENLIENERRKKILEAAGRLRFMVSREDLAKAARGRTADNRTTITELVHEGALVMRRRHGRDVFGLPTTPLDDPDAGAASRPRKRKRTSRKAPKADAEAAS